MVEMILSDPEFGFYIPADIASAIYTVIKVLKGTIHKQKQVMFNICFID